MEFLKYFLTGKTVPNDSVGGLLPRCPEPFTCQATSRFLTHAGKFSRQSPGKFIKLGPERQRKGPLEAGPGDKSVTAAAAHGSPGTHPEP